MSIYSPATRQELLDYCLRQLGSPVLEINVDQDQLEDRFEEALQFYREFHHDGSELTYLKQQIEASTLNLQSGNGNTFVIGDVITGANSQAKCTVHSLVSDNVLSVKNTTGTFIVNESISSNKSNITGKLANTNPIVLGNYDNRYFEIDEKVISITKCLQLNSSGSGGNNLFDFQYQMMLNSMPTLTSFDIGYYTQLMTHLNTINQTLVGQKPIRFRRHTNRLYLDWNWNTATIGNYIVVEAFSVLDPESFTNVYNDMFLKKYLTSLIKRQWGTNMKKFNAIQLPGAVIMNVQQIYDEAIQEIKELELECQNTFQEPTDFFVG